MKKYNLRLRDRTYIDGTYIFGILNATPDSFYPESRVGGNIVAVAEKMLRDGAEVLDIGGQSTRPGAEKVDVLTEIQRVLPAIKALKANCPRALLSVDTFYPEVAEECLKCGADIINDVSGVSDEMAFVLAKYGAATVAMRDSRNSCAEDILQDKIDGLNASINRLLAAGADIDKIILDGGIGFNRSKDEDKLLLDRYGELVERFDLPFLLGASRKSFMGGDVEGRLEKTVAATEFAASKGVMFVRVHDVYESAVAIKNLKKHNTGGKF